MKVTTNYIAFWGMLIMSMQTQNKWLGGLLIVMAIVSFVVHLAEQKNQG